MRAEKGFTLIELLIVVVVLGILAVMAVPYFANANTSARISGAQGIGANMSSAASIIFGTKQANGTVATVALLSSNYPANTAAGIGVASGIYADDGTTLTINTNAWTVVAGSGAAAFTVQAVGVTTPANCGVSYNANASTTTAPPIITITTTGC